MKIRVKYIGLLVLAQLSWSENVHAMGDTNPKKSNKQSKEDDKLKNWIITTQAVVIASLLVYLKYGVKNVAQSAQDLSRAARRVPLSGAAATPQDSAYNGWSKKQANQALMAFFDEKAGEVVGALVTLGADVQQDPTLVYRTPGMHLDELKMLVYHGFDIDWRDAQGNTALHLRAAEVISKCVDNLLEANADVNLQNNEGKTPLHVALERTGGPVTPIVQALGAAQDLKTDIKDKAGYTVLDLLHPDRRPKKLPVLNGYLMKNLPNSLQGWNRS